MTVRQWMLKKIYPLLIRVQDKKSKASILNNRQQKTGAVSFYSLEFTRNDGTQVSLNQLKGKKLLIVNTASDCGYTAQYSELQKLYESNSDRLEIIGFPSNDFKEQEKETDDAIAQFCSVNFGVTFPLAKKSTVVKSSSQNELFRWLSDANKNGWNNQSPEWNFSKYLINENGILTHYFPPATGPLSKEMLHALQL